MHYCFLTAPLCFHIPSLISNCLNLCPLELREENTESLLCPRAPQSLAQFHRSHSAEETGIYGHKSMCFYGCKTDRSLKSPTSPTAFQTFSSLPNLFCPSTSFQLISSLQKKKGNHCISLYLPKNKNSLLHNENIFYTYTTSCCERASVLPFLSWFPLTFLGVNLGTDLSPLDLSSPSQMILFSSSALLPTWLFFPSNSSLSLSSFQEP